MKREFADMDDWSPEQVAEFKEQGQIKETDQPIPESAAAAAIGKLVAEGDSWFDYLPGTDLVDCLRNNHDYRIKNAANAGDTLENMIYGTRITKKFQRASPTIDRVLRRLGQLKPKVFLFSGGGNDVAGEEFEYYLNHKQSGLTALREAYVSEMMDHVFPGYFQDLVTKVAEVSPATHIVTHGYGHTVPTGEGVDLLFFTFAGPWLRPALAKKGVFDPTEQSELVFDMIDRYNQMLQQFDQNHDKFHYVDLRPLIEPDQDWANELHLKNGAYARAAARIDEAIQSI